MAAMYGLAFTSTTPSVEAWLVKETTTGVDLSSYTALLRHPPPVGLGCSHSVALEVQTELLRFLAMKVTFQDTVASPHAAFSCSSPLDAAWHLLLLKPRLYAAVCAELGDVIDHDPALSLPEEAGARRERLERARRAYRRVYGAEPPPAWRDDYDVTRDAAADAPPAPPVAPSNAPLPSEFIISIKTLTGKSLPLKVGPDTTVHNVCNMITAVEGIPGDQQRIIFAGQQFETGFTDFSDVELPVGKNARKAELRRQREAAAAALAASPTMKAIGVAPEATLHLMIRLRGC